MNQMEKTAFNQGLALLSQPVLPLVSMVQFLYLTGPFEHVAEVIEQLPCPIETAHSCYHDPAALLTPYLDLLTGLHRLKDQDALDFLVEDESGVVLDRMSAVCSLVGQQVLTRELEAINSALCAPCGCSLCCVGPEKGMQQEFFDIPLRPGEEALFAVERLDSAASQATTAHSESPLLEGAQPFFHHDAARCIHFGPGWSLILPKGTRCPALAADGRCRIYADRPQVCRHPQLFAYLLEDLAAAVDGRRRFRLRQSLLAITDCPYVRTLRDEITVYSAASELETVFSANKG